MRMSTLLVKTEKHAPADAQLKSHQLLVRSGLVHQLSAGIYSLTPLATQVLHRIADIAREAMNDIGGQEVLLPVVQPAALWQASGRYETVDAALVRFADRNQQEMVLALTHEEAATELVRNVVHSYRQLPLMIYQLQTKFRDEARPRGGLVRLREFLMKDAYSFHETTEDLNSHYAQVLAAYARFYQRCGLDVLAVESDTGMMGGGEAHEFMFLDADGEDTLLLCPTCDYAANREVAVGRRALGSGEMARNPSRVDEGEVDDAYHCVRCGSLLQRVRGIEVGNIFKLGIKYSSALQANFTAADGRVAPLVMGCYGIGITRVLACLIQQHHDENGIVWPESVAPYPYHLVVIGADARIKETAERIYQTLGKRHVLFDDRAVAAGSKLKDADLLGMPVRITVSQRTLEEGRVELRQRANGRQVYVPLAVIGDSAEWARLFAAMMSDKEIAH